MMMSPKDRIARVYASGASDETGALRRVVACYDAALFACVRRDGDALDTILCRMQENLDFSAWPSLGLVLYAQYGACRDHAAKGAFLEAGRILAKLRTAWLEGGRRQGLVPAA
jgi:hypothetical protein